MSKVIGNWNNDNFVGLPLMGLLGTARFGRAAGLKPEWLSLSMPNGKKWLKGGAAALLLVILAAGLLVWCGQRDKLIPAEVAVVLGNEVYRDGRPAPRLAARLDKSVELYRYGYCKTIIVSGGVGKSEVDEATAMAAYLKSKGVPEWDIVVDSTGVNTWHTALFTAEYLKKQRLDSVIVVSQAFHIPRSAMALKKAGCEQVGQASPSYWEWRDVYSTLREMAAIVFYWWQY